MTRLKFDRYCGEIVRQTDQLRALLGGADLTATVPSCPDWTLGELARHVGGAHRWAAELVRTRARDDIPEEAVPDHTGPADGEPAALDVWLADGAALLAAELRAAGSGAEVWSWGWDRTAHFWARRMTHETVVHRADAALAVRVPDEKEPYEVEPYEVEPAVAADAIDEWLRIVEFAAADGDAEALELRGAGRGIHLHATDPPEALGGVEAEWLIEFTDDGFNWGRGGHGKGTVALRGGLTELLLVFYRRLPVGSGRVTLLGDTELMDFWLERASFG